jgi:hypothetical protein
MTNTAVAIIGNGLFVRTGGKPGWYEQLLRKQATCAHAKRDPKGTCYGCGQKDPK